VTQAHDDDAEAERRAHLRSANEKLVLAALRAEALAEQAEGLRLLIESVEGYAIYVLDPRGCVSTWNAGAERMHGYTTSEILDRHFAVFYPLSDVASGKHQRELDAAERDGRYEDEGFRVRKDGSQFFASVVITALRDPAGKLVGFGKVTRDLTERVRMEEERVERARAEEADRRKDEFMAIMGHELRNPLAPMVTALHLIKLRRGRNSEREIAVLERQLHHMMRLVDDLLDVSRLLRDKITLSKQVIEIGELLANSIDVASPQITAKRHILQIDVPSTPLLVEVDPARIVQVLGNLLTNAAKYTDEGGKICVRAAAEDDQIVVDVEDTGIGIAPELIPRIFDLFTQGGQGIERQLGGLGVGLAVARRLVDVHGGRLEVFSEGIGRGARFTMRLPTTAEGPATKRALPSAPPPAVSQTVTSKRVLIVDDNEDSMEMMAAFVCTLRHDVRTATNGPRALEIAREYEPDVMFLDIGLPGMDGLELVRRARRLPGCASISIVAVSGYASEADRKRALDSGFSEHIAKPIQPAAIEAVIEKAVCRKRG
jgi:PAS domain S-box-containing protein